MPNNEESKKVLTEVIKRQMAILGPDITLAKVKNVPGLEVDANGQVVKVDGDAQAVLASLINQFVELSGLIVKKTMESVLVSAVDEAKLAASAGTNAAQAPTAASSPPQQVPQAPQITEHGPEGYNIGAVSSPQAPAPQSQQPQQVSDDIQSANKEIEDLNKMLNSLPK